MAEDTFLAEAGEVIEKKVLGFNIFNLHTFIDNVGEWGISRGMACMILFAGLYAILSFEIPSLPLFTLAWLAGTAPVWLPIGLIIGTWRVWVWYVQSHFIAGRKPVLLEMKIPREITKSPRAMEVALTNLWLSSGETTFLDRGWKGQVRPWYALEIASFGGDVHFYIWCWGNYRNFVEQSIYGQYPEVELYEVEDYASKFVLDPKKHWCFATDWRKEPHNKGGVYGKGDFPRSDCYPIKTYVDFELDKDPKEEHKVDPLGTILEFMGSIKPHEQIWVSLVIRRAGKYNILNTQERDTEWREAMEEEVSKVRVHGAIVPQSLLRSEMEEAGLDEDARPPQIRPSWRQNQMMQSMERNLSKLPFEFVGHGVYITSGEVRGPFFTSVRWIWKAFGNQSYMTHLRPRRWHNPYDYPWQDFAGYRRNTMTASRFFDCYRRRAGFHTPWILPTNVLTVEELATLWHPPSRTVAVPGLERIPATKAPPPSNLPT
ncbi:MAG TPA: hypothetical protein VMH91_03655 [Candidatus Paceibacterota bacterium]|nr:hypothetical protein [Candidatus Paceibacterota bacterium]